MVWKQAGQIVLGFCATCSYAAAALDDAATDELKRHQGTWVTTASIHNGQQAPDEIVHSIRRIVTGDHVIWERNGKRFAGTKIELGLGRQPQTIDVIPDGGPNRSERILGIYKLEGDTLTICMARAGQPRPGKFEAAKGSDWTLQTFRRERSTRE